MPRIPRSNYHKDLQSSVTAGNVVNWIAQRNWGLRMMQRLMMKPLVGQQIDGLINEEIFIPSTSSPGHNIRARVYKPKDAKGPLPGLIYAHGGGYQVGVPEQAHAFFEDLIKRRDVAIIAPAYRLSLDGHPFPHGLNDCYDTLLYMKSEAKTLGLRDDKFIIAGHSGGGGMAAALTHKTIDSKAADIAFQMPIYPMIDHRMQTKSAQMTGSAIWDRGSNSRAWDNYLGHLGGDVPEYASPALRSDLSGLPPTISFVGDMEPFKDETIAYMTALEKAGVPTKFKLYEGAFHGFEVVATKAPVSLDAMAFQADAFAEFYDLYL